MEIQQSRSKYGLVIPVTYITPTIAEPVLNESSTGAILEGIASILWPLFAFAVLYFLVQNANLLKRFVIEWGNKKLLVDLKEEVATAQAELAKESASIDTSEEEPQKTKNKLILWAVGNQAGASSALKALKNLGYSVKEVGHKQFDDEFPRLKKDVGVVVTNFQHGQNRSAGIAIVDFIRSTDQAKATPIILFTSPSAVKRRKGPIEEMNPDHVATELQSLVSAIVETIG